MDTTKLGKSDIEICAIGMGCWAIGGPLYYKETPIGWGKTDDDESLRALACAHELGVDFFDVADVYGAGHGERLVGQAFAGKREQVVIATKFGNIFDEECKQVTGQGADADFIIEQCERSLARLQTDYIDLYQFHINEYNPKNIDGVVAALERLVKAGKIRAYGWSTDALLSAQAMLGNAHYHAVQFQQNVLDPNEAMNSFTREHTLSAINRGPLAMGLLSGKYSAASTIGIDDVRGTKAPEWMQYFKDGKPSQQYLQKLDAIREILTSDGRTLVQGALAWLRSTGAHIIPIPGIRTEAQARENFSEGSFRRYSAAQMQEIERLRDAAANTSSV